MMRVSEFTGSELVCSQKLGEELTGAIVGLSVLYSDEQVTVISMSKQDAEIRAHLEQHGRHISPRFMDRFFIESVEDDRVRQALLTGFFQILAPTYRTLVDVDRNHENIGILLTIIQSNMTLKGEEQIADLGCGVGLSIDVAARNGLNVLGIDPCPNMRHFAEMNGLRTLGAGDVARLPRNSLQAAFASYVFHLIPEYGLLRLTWQRMECGGVLAANFHKNQGVEQFQAVMHEIGGTVVDLTPQFASTRHGQYLAYRKT